jgi:hypothetical protein
MIWDMGCRSVKFLSPFTNPLPRFKPNTLWRDQEKLRIPVNQQHFDKKKSQLTQN